MVKYNLRFEKKTRQIFSIGPLKGNFFYFAVASCALQRNHQGGTEELTMAFIQPTMFATIISHL